MFMKDNLFDMQFEGDRLNRLYTLYLKALRQEVKMYKIWQR